MKKFIYILVMTLGLFSCQIEQKLPPPIQHQGYVRYGGQPIVQYSLFISNVDENNPVYSTATTRISVVNVSSYMIDSCVIVIQAYLNDEKTLENNINRIIVKPGTLAAGDSISFEVENTNNIWSQTSPSFEEEFIQIHFTLGNTYNNRNGIYSGKYVTLHDSTVNNIKNALGIITADDRFIIKISGTQEVKTITGDIYLNNFLCIAEKKDGAEITSLTQDSLYFQNDTLYLRFIPTLTNNADSADIIELTMVKTNEL